MRFNHLNIPEHWQQYWTKYPNGYTILEALLNWVGQVDSMVDNQNDLNLTVEGVVSKLDNFLEQFAMDLQESVETTLGEWQTSGFLTIVINNALQTQIDDVQLQVNDRPTKTAVAADIATAKTELTDLITIKTNALEKASPSPYPHFYGMTGIVDVPQGGAGAMDSAISGEPFIVWDDENGTYRMFYFGLKEGTQEVYCLSATSANLHGGTWAKTMVNLSAEGLTNAHKLSLLVDLSGNPVKVNGKYHGYVVGYPTKHIRHWETDKLGNKWNDTGIVLQPNFAGNGSDTRAVDAPCAVWDDQLKQVVLFYLAQPATALGDYGLAHRTNRAVSADPATGFTYDGVACLPSGNSSDWHYGWIGGAQLQREKDGSIWVALNAGSTRPVTAGAEPDSLWGMARTDDLYSPWTVDKTPKSYIPFVGEANKSLVVPPAIEETNIWRPFLIYDHVVGKWLCYYNTGTEGDEKITHSFQGHLYYYYNAPNGSVVLDLTEKVIPCTKIKLAKGKYNIRLEANVMGCSTVLTKADIVLKCYVNGFVMTKTQRLFLGNYNYENTNTVFNIPLVVHQENREVEFRGIVTGGTPSLDTKVRDFSITVEQI